ncbi:GSCOCG00002104001-RA-CDS [Cotesia congregata]|uniref:DNA polymerase subunit gamma-1 n=1 Tax=Cotesia congregata TaxID=51543 RepID=A0A8J2HPI8_COTCN|nr:GSCOCG00002104001-RA-CDS [Cotesia congregata]CAG5104174.1 Similar to tam: DNA polymerase subunit gamma-1 [Cotesia congregata]
MRLKVKLINICIRHKCSKPSINGLTKLQPKFSLRKIKVKKSAKPINTELTSPASRDLNIKAIIHPEDEYQQFCAGNFNNKKNKDKIIDSRQLKDKKSASADNSENQRNNCEERFNELNMQMLPRKLHSQVFKKANNVELSREKLSELRKQLKAFGMKINDTSRIPSADIDLPPLEGEDLEEHFYKIAETQARPYFKIVEEMLRKIPEMPTSWKLQEGWTRYTTDKVEKVDYPLEPGIIFDVEVCMKEGPLPTLATAVTSEAWYGWVSKPLVDGTSLPIESRSFTLDMLVPLESTSLEFGKKLTDHQKKPKIIVGHNVCYDRARIKEQYWLNPTSTRFIDTMSLHIAISGMNSYQRALMLAKKDLLDHEELQGTSLNNLADVYKLYCGKTHEKSMRDLFVEGSLLEVRKEFDKLMNYCARDVVVTHEILEKLFPIFKERFPHPVSFAGMLELGTAYLPVNTNWTRYIEESEVAFEDLNYEAKVSLAKRADEVCKLMHGDKYKEDLWMWDQDWSTQAVKIKKKPSKIISSPGIIGEEKEISDEEKYLTDGEEEIDELEKEFGYLKESKNLLPAKLPHMPGYPAWYRKLCMKPNEENWTFGPKNISTSMKITPKLLSLTWENYPLHYIKEHGWGFLVPFNSEDVETQLPLKQLLAQCPLPIKHQQSSDTSYAMATLQAEVQKDLHKTEFWRNRKTKSDVKKSMPGIFYKGAGIWCDVIIDNCCWFFKLPHKDGPKLNVGNPLAKDFLNKFSENVLAGLDSSAREVLKISKMVSYWRNNRDRIMSQLVVWLSDSDLPGIIRRTGSSSALSRQNYGAIIPQVVVSGTLTRRATEATWMTASNAHEDRVGSELRAMVQAPPGYSIVGADVDSQELWIASLIGDAYCAGIHGATPFGWMTLIGNKSDGTDMHSVTAKAVGISRDHAKVINYARIYGAGQKFAERLLKQFNPAMSDGEALGKSRKMFSITKGKKVFKLREEFVNEELQDEDYSGFDASRVAKLHGKTVQAMFESKWEGGSESAMFNRLEEIAGSKHPVTPFLNSRLSRALEVEDELKDKYLPTKINWVVQSGAVDFLHLMLVCMRWLMRDNARFCLSFHDEIRYLVPGRYKYNAALAMHVTNLLTRSFCASRLGIQDLPASVAFFAAVEVDTVLRKEASSDCKTPSNPYGLESRYGVAKGESLDVWKAVDKAEGSLGPWHNALIRKNKVDNQLG